MAKRKTPKDNGPSLQVVMHSDEFGVENFECDTIEEAEAGLERLKKECRQADKKDGIERRRYLVIADWETGEDFGS